MASVRRKANLIVDRQTRAPLVDIWPIAERMGQEEFAGESPEDYDVAMADLYSMVHGESVTSGRVGRRMRRRVKKVARGAYGLAKKIANNPKLKKAMKAIQKVAKNKYFQSAIVAISAAIPGMQGAAAAMAAYMVAIQMAAMLAKKALKAAKKGGALGKKMKNKARKGKLAAAVLKADAEGDQTAMLAAAEAAEKAGVNVERELIGNAEELKKQAQAAVRKNKATWARVRNKTALAINKVKIADRTLFTEGKLNAVRKANGKRVQRPKFPKVFFKGIPWRRTPKQAYEAGMKAGAAMVAKQAAKKKAAKKKAVAKVKKKPSVVRSKSTKHASPQVFVGARRIVLQGRNARVTGSNRRPGKGRVVVLYKSKQYTFDRSRL